MLYLDKSICYYLLKYIYLKLTISCPKEFFLRVPRNSTFYLEENNNNNKPNQIKCV